MLDLSLSRQHTHAHPSLALSLPLSQLFLQDFTGDVTLMPPFGLSDYLAVLSDPTPASMAKFLRVGQQEAWRKSAMLATRLRIDAALRSLRKACG